MCSESKIKYRVAVLLQAESHLVHVYDDTKPDKNIKIYLNYPLFACSKQQRAYNRCCCYRQKVFILDATMVPIRTVAFDVIDSMNNREEDTLSNQTKSLEMWYIISSLAYIKKRFSILWALKLVLL